MGIRIELLRSCLMGDLLQHNSKAREFYLFKNAEDEEEKGWLRLGFAALGN